MKNIKANYLIRNSDADEIDEEGQPRYAVEYCFKDFENDFVIEYGLDYDYFNTEDEAFKIIDEFNKKSKGIIEVGTVLIFDIYRDFERYSKKETMLKVEYLGNFLDKGISTLTPRFKILDYGTQCPKYKDDIVSLSVSYSSLYYENFIKVPDEITRKIKPKFLDTKTLSEKAIQNYILKL